MNDWDFGLVTGPTLLRTVAALLLAVATVTLFVGFAVEQAAEHEEAEHEADIPATAGEAGEEHAEEREGATEGGQGGDEAESHAEEGAEVAAHSKGSEAILGFAPESTGAIAVAVVLSVLLTAAMWLRGTPAVLLVAAAFALMLAVLDVREALHRADESRDGLVILALLSAALHVGVAIASSVELRERSTNTLPVARA